ncbi:hypothetical protein PC41400_14675 [Paenibacillus chitinolyticus]|uniref:Uncharacterized protein n=1 Tax=Paenibacillus chitinolyticus TaxID=79263 RepID=A0A410WWV8_9BACL|nr:hypothetical protein [Paenibacillus chitinolyticus]MCY9593984.1 hypothetical protein [Paenibacillus chitinolyticus]MCY9599639.1 hypothetical protein [Paenibacillus chitinolyticus]QAV18854.1 hypothetical protein PC41400_14675 [Paenibacillus chitinolyticus]
MFKKLEFKSTSIHKHESWVDFGIKKSHYLISKGNNDTYMIWFDGKDIGRDVHTLEKSKELAQAHYDNSCRLIVEAITMK